MTKTKTETTEPTLTEVHQHPMEVYKRRVTAIENGDKSYRESAFYQPLSFTMLPPPCGCTIEGDGNIPSPLHIRFCAQHWALKVTL